jgi:hypothetical protein
MAQPDPNATDQVSFLMFCSLIGGKASLSSCLPGMQHISLTDLLVLENQCH